MKQQVRIFGQSVERLALLLLISGVVGLSSCGEPLTPEQQAERKSVTAKILWSETGSSNYQMLMTRQRSFAREEEYNVTVRKNAIVSVVSLSTGEEVTGDHGLLTVNELFALIEQYQSENPDDYFADYDPVLGYPNRTNFDLSAVSVDGGYGFRIQDLTLR